MFRARWSSRLGVALLVSLAPGCQRKPAPRAEPTPRVAPAASSQMVVTVASAAPMPLEAPVEILRVPNSGFPCAVDDVLAAKCRRCHTVPGRHNAPFSLLTWEDTRGMAGDHFRYLVMASATKSGYMPYNIEANPPIERLTDDEKKVIADWVEAGAPKAACPPAPATEAKRPPKAIGSGRPSFRPRSPL